LSDICPDGGTGRRAGLKNQWEFSLAGSIPAPGTFLIIIFILIRQSIGIKLFQIFFVKNVNQLI
jgi:hypothetical protein